MASVQQRPADLTLNKYSLEYPIEELKRATRDFDPAGKLGDGSFGAVFHGIQSDGTDVAVKVLDVPEEAGFEEEVRVLSKFRHPNLVILMGFARCGSQRFLVYELLGGGDVYKRLQRCCLEGEPFSWRQRASAAFDASCGLSHLHNSSPKVFHRDIKSPNILLDRNGTAKMADFGLACLSHTKARKVERAAGTIGYACPLYAQRRVVTEGSEVYSFGIVLLELLTATPPAWLVPNSEGKQTYRFLAKEIRGDVDIAMGILDETAHWPQDVARAVVELALRCTHCDEATRPQFTQVVNVLRKLRDAPDESPPANRAGAASAAQVAQAQRPAVEPAAPPCASEATLRDFTFGMPRLWSLECVFAQGVDSLEAIPHEERTLVHRQEPGLPLAAQLTVGRSSQEELFRALLADTNTRHMVSREHFQIYAQQANNDLVPDCFSIGCVPCSFFLSNLSSTSTMVNSTLLDDHSKYVELHSGDHITVGRKVLSPDGACYVPLLQFRFDLSGSVLYDVSAKELDTAPPEFEVALPVPEKSVWLASTASPGLGKGVSLPVGVVPRFMLEIGGTGVLQDVVASCRVLVHGPEAQSADGAMGAFAPLVLGCGHETAFWRGLLRPEAFCAMAWEHVTFEAVGSAERSKQPAAVSVRRCSYAYPVVVCSKDERHATEYAHGLEPSDRHILQHGDMVVLVPDEKHSVWLSFRDLLAPRRRSVAGGA